jgi:hypothetical protein
VIILLTSGLVLGCTIVYGVEKPATHYALVASVGALVATALFLVLETFISLHGRNGNVPGTAA